MGEVLLRAEFARRGLSPDCVRSAGVAATDGAAAHPDAVRVAPEFGVRLESHRARRMTRDLVEGADLLVLMDELNAAILLDRFPEAVSRVVLLGAFESDRRPFGDQIPDPFGEGVASVRSSYVRISRCAAALADEIAALVKSPATAP